MMPAQARTQSHEMRCPAYRLIDHTDLYVLGPDASDIARRRMVEVAEGLASRSQRPAKCVLVFGGVEQLASRSVAFTINTLETSTITNKFIIVEFEFSRFWMCILQSV